MTSSTNTPANPAPATTTAASDTAQGAVAAQNQAAANSGPLDASQGQALAGVQSAAKPADTLKTSEDTIRKAVENDAHGFFHRVLADALEELHIVSLYTKEEVAHIEAVFKKHAAK